MNAIDLSSQLGWFTIGLGAAVAVGLAMMIGFVIDRVATARRSAALFSALNDSAWGTPVASLPPGANGFAATVEPPPEPFSQFQVQHETGRVFNPLAWLFPASIPRKEYLFFFANLPSAPTQEIAWARHRTPPAAVGAAPDRTLWMLHTLDIIEGEYATRGDNPNGVRHVFVELQTRFGPQLEQLTVYRDDAFHVRVMIQATPLVPTEVLTLVGLVRALGRAGQF